MTGQFVAVPSRIQIQLTLLGPLDRGALDEALTSVVRRHESLHTRIDATAFEDLQVSSAVRRVVAARLAEGQSFMTLARDGLLHPASELLGPTVFKCVADDSVRACVVERSVDTLDDSAQQSMIEQIGRDQLATPFDYATIPAIRVTLVRQGLTRHELILTADYVACDGRSIELLLDELFASYGALMQGRAPYDATVRPFSEYAAWERDRFTGDRFDVLLRYCRDMLSQVSQSSSVRRHHAAHNRNVVSSRITIDGALLQSVLTSARRRRMTPYVHFISAYGEALRTLTDQPVVPIVTTAPNRLTVPAQAMIGRFSNPHIVSLAHRDRRPSVLLGDVADAVRRVYDHQELPLFAATAWARMAMPQAWASFRMRRASEQWKVGELVARQTYTPHRVARMDVECQVVQRERDLEIVADANPLLFDENELDSLLSQMVDNVSKTVGAAA